MPKRIQRKRSKGWQMPEGALYVGRPTKWGNPFALGDCLRTDDPLMEFVAWQVPGGVRGLASIRLVSADVVVAAYDRWICCVPPLMLSARDELGGHDLACWCPLDRPCHADVLLEIANEPAAALASQRPSDNTGDDHG